MLDPKTSLYSRRLYKYLKDSGRASSREFASLCHLQHDCIQGRLRRPDSVLCTEMFAHTSSGCPMRNHKPCLPDVHCPPRSLAATLLEVLTNVEGLVDVLALGACGTCFYVFNNWVKDAMEVVKEREQRNKAAASSGTPAGQKKRR
jgi:hypothetical protein